jgi:hypothetical protein
VFVIYGFMTIVSMGLKPANGDLDGIVASGEIV